MNTITKTFKTKKEVLYEIYEKLDWNYLNEIFKENDNIANHKLQMNNTTLILRDKEIISIPMNKEALYGSKDIIIWKWESDTE